jgi:hypothetical protein
VLLLDRAMEVSQPIVANQIHLNIDLSQ